MKVEQIYTGCLAQGAYYIESENEVVIIDPLREPTPYLERAKKMGHQIRYVLETHFHADFVSGHVDLAEKTGATIVFGPHANPSYPSHIAKDGEIIHFGKVSIEVLHTPGHTMESTTFLLRDEQGRPHSIFTGDTLFIGDVGRPDLAVKSHLSEADLAGMLFDSLRNKIMTLPDEVMVYPAHGAGSACGKNMSKETYDTLGHQKQVNYALRADMTKDEFIREVTDGLTPPPGYFPENVRLNKEGYPSLDEVKSEGMRPLTVEAFEMMADAFSALILDTRSPQAFSAGFIPGSINIGIDGSFAPWVGALIPDIKQPILIVSEAGKEEEVITRLSRVGYDRTLGYLMGGFNTWKAAGKPIDQMENISAADFAADFANDPKIFIADVRKSGEFESSHIIGAHHLPLDYINEHLAEFPKTEPLYIHCAGGYRSMIASSILAARGWTNLINVEGGFKAIQETAQIPLTDAICPTTGKKLS